AAVELKACLAVLHGEVNRQPGHLRRARISRNSWNSLHAGLSNFPEPPCASGLPSIDRTQRHTRPPSISASFTRCGVSGAAGSAAAPLERRPRSAADADGLFRLNRADAKTRTFAERKQVRHGLIVAWRQQWPDLITA